MGGAAVLDAAPMGDRALGESDADAPLSQRDQIREILRCTHGNGTGPYNYFATQYCLTLDDAGVVATIPAWQYVKDYFSLFQSDEDMHVEKARQMLATWLLCSGFLCALMFRPGFAGFLGSRKERLVDDGGENSTPNSLLGRIRFMYDRLPDWMRQARPVSFSHLRLECKVNGSFIVGEGANGEIGRGGTFMKAGIDEAAMLEQSEASHRSIRLACQRGLLYQSTPNGRANVFARIKFESPGAFKFLTCGWPLHPMRRRGMYYDVVTGRPRSPWYDRMSADMTTDAVARELDISYEHSVSGLVWPQFSEACLDDSLLYCPDIKADTGLDFGIGAATAGVLGQVHIGADGMGEFHVLDDYELQGQPVEVHARNIESKWRALGYQGTRRQVQMFGDPAGRAREMVRGSTVVWAYGVEGYENFVTPKHPLRDGLGLVARLFHQKRIKVHPRCAVLRRRLPDYRYPTDDLGHVMGDEPVKTGTAASATHVADGLRYVITGRFPIHDSGVVRSVVAPPPLRVPVAHGPELDRHRYRHPFRGLASGRYRPDGTKRIF